MRPGRGRPLRRRRAPGSPSAQEYPESRRRSAPGSVRHRPSSLAASRPPTTGWRATAPRPVGRRRYPRGVRARRAPQPDLRHLRFGRGGTGHRPVHRGTAHRSARPVPSGIEKTIEGRKVPRPGRCGQPIPDYLHGQYRVRDPVSPGDDIGEDRLEAAPPDRSMETGEESEPHRHDVDVDVRERGAMPIASSAIAARVSTSPPYISSAEIVARTIARSIRSGPSRSRAASNIDSFSWST